MIASLSSWKNRWSFAVALCAVTIRVSAASTTPPLAPSIEAEEDVYTFENPNNGSGPLWCHGSTCLVRVGDDVYASGVETIKDAKPLNNCRWLLFKRGANGWKKELTDTTGRTREPSPMAGFSNGRLLLSVNPTLTAPDTYSGPAQPQILEFATRKGLDTFERLLPVWEGAPKFTEHSYRSFAADGPGRELILFQNIDYTHAEWTFRNQAGKWVKQGKLRWPAGVPGSHSEVVRVCYPNVLLQHRAVYFCGVSDIIEPNPEWRAFKKELTGQQWDYDFRRLFFTWTPNITKEPFHDWIEIASRDATCGWISPGDLWVAPDGAVHIVWTERAIDERLRAKFFPEAKQSHSLNYAVVRHGKVDLRRTVQVAEEGRPGLIPAGPRLQPTPEHRLLLVYYVSGTDASGQSVSENRVQELYPNGEISPAIKIPFKQPFTFYFTASVRGGSAPARKIEMLGQCNGAPQTIRYAKVKLY